MHHHHSLLPPRTYQHVYGAHRAGPNTSTKGASTRFTRVRVVRPSRFSTPPLLAGKRVCVNSDNRSVSQTPSQRYPVRCLTTAPGRAMPSFTWLTLDRSAKCWGLPWCCVGGRVSAASRLSRAWGPYAGFIQIYGGIARWRDDGGGGPPLDAHGRCAMQPSLWLRCRTTPQRRAG